MAYSLYILKSENEGAYYVGSTNNVQKRLAEHNHRHVRSTKQKAPWRIVYVEEFSTRAEARKREDQIKAWKKRSAIERLFRSQ